MREPNVQIELTPKEVLLNAECMYLAIFLLNHPEVFKDDANAVKAAWDILQNREEWQAYCYKMQKVCVAAQSSKGC